MAPLRNNEFHFVSLKALELSNVDDSRLFNQKLSTDTTIMVLIEKYVRE